MPMATVFGMFTESRSWEFLLCIQLDGANGARIHAPYWTSMDGCVCGTVHVPALVRALLRSSGATPNQSKTTLVETCRRFLSQLCSPPPTPLQPLATRNIRTASFAAHTASALLSFSSTYLIITSDSPIIINLISEVPYYPKQHNFTHNKSPSWACRLS